jgi:hypothetical protein
MPLPCVVVGLRVVGEPGAVVICHWSSVSVLSGVGVSVIVVVVVVEVVVV